MPTAQVTDAGMVVSAVPVPQSEVQEWGQRLCEAQWEQCLGHVILLGVQENV